ncbi:MAG: nucleotidyltransferase domain-containing protein [Candidatus Verstraetearchaeota archaeon]|nr:nucleotidyltransferase domain-containing protein [Candidatus Verstraetearchaeota archaeon]
MSRKDFNDILKCEGVRDLTEDLKELINELVREFKPLKIILTGSLARGRFVRGLSDIDILVIVDEVKSKDRFMLKTIKDVDVEITVISKDEFEKAINMGREFYIEAIKWGIIVHQQC